MHQVVAREPLPTSAVAPEPKPQLVKALEPEAAPLEAEASTEKPKEEVLSPRFAALARKEKALFQQQQAIKAERDKILAEKAEYEKAHIPRDRLAKDPLGALQENGITLEQLTQLILNGPEAEDKNLLEIRKELAAVKEASLETKQRLEEEKTRAYENAVNQIRNQAKMLIDSNEEFASIKETDNAEAVVELIKETHAKDGTILSVEEAARQVEEYLVEEAMKMSSLTKIKQKLSLGASPQGEQKQQTPIEQKQPLVKTLTNEATTPSSKPLTAKERRQRAILAFQGKL